MSTGIYRVKSYPDPLELNLQAVVNHPGWVLGAKLQSFARAVRALRLSRLPSLWLCNLTVRLVLFPTLARLGEGCPSPEDTLLAVLGTLLEIAGTRLPSVGLV